MARVLLVGYVPEFLKEREKTLRAAGHEVTAAPSFATASTAIERELFDVAVMGVSVPDDERNQLARRLKHASPAAKIIMLYFTSVKNTELADALMQAGASAEEVLRAVNHLLNERDRSRTG